ncbi:MAG: cell surface protein SprA, partial [Bacteroidota bacterium]
MNDPPPGDPVVLELDPFDLLDPGFNFPRDFSPPQDTSKKDTNKKEEASKESPLDKPAQEKEDKDVGGNFVAPLPGNVETTYELAPDGEGYIVREQVNGKDIRPPSYISRQQLEELRNRQARDRFFQEQERVSQGRAGGGNSLIPPINVNSNLFKTIFGSPRIDIKPNVSVLLDFSIRRNVMKNPALALRQQRNTTFFFDQQIQLNVVGSVGERLNLNLNYDTEATFDFENQYKIGFQGDEDDIIKSVEAGNVSLPVNGSLIQGGQNLWGVKVATQWGPLFVTTVASQQRGKTQEIVVNGGGQQTNFDVTASDYDYNRHFFLNHYFRGLYEQSLSQLPAVNSPIQITRVEVWVTNRNNASTQNNRNAIGFVDMGENTTATGGEIWNQNFINATGSRPANGANNLFSVITASGQSNNRNQADDYLESQGLTNGQDFELVENMRLLNPNEYILNSQLGYISLNSRLQPNDVLFVAYEYTVAGSNEPFKVGEFTQDKPQDDANQNLLFLKMLKPSSIRPELDDRPYPTWDLMMKNVYSIGGSNLEADGFRMDIIYEATDGSGDINYLPTSAVGNTPLVQVFDIDQLTNNMEVGPDNIFDFIPNVTVQPEKGTIIFPVLEPFGSHLTNQLGPPGSDARARDSTLYAYQPLYDLTQQDAIQYYPQLDRYKFTGFYTGAGGSEIYLNSVQVTEGSVTVTAGGTQLQEGSDFEVDYQIGKVTILNPGVMASGQEIRVRFESNDLFGVDQKSLIGVRLDYKEFDDLTLGATMVYLNERPLINKINIGDEP